MPHRHAVAPLAGPATSLGWMAALFAAMASAVGAEAAPLIWHMNMNPLPTPTICSASEPAAHNDTLAPPDCFCVGQPDAAALRPFRALQPPQLRCGHGETRRACGVRRVQQEHHQRPASSHQQPRQQPVCRRADLAAHPRTSARCGGVRSVRSQHRAAAAATDAQPAGHGDGGCGVRWVPQDRHQRPGSSCQQLRRPSFLRRADASQRRHRAAAGCGDMRSVRCLDRAAALRPDRQMVGHHGQNPRSPNTPPKPPPAAGRR